MRDVNEGIQATGGSRTFVTNPETNQGLHLADAPTVCHVLCKLPHNSWGQILQRVYSVYFPPKKRKKRPRLVRYPLMVLGGVLPNLDLY